MFHATLEDSTPGPCTCYSTIGPKNFCTTDERLGQPLATATTGSATALMMSGMRGYIARSRVHVTIMLSLALCMSHCNHQAPFTRLSGDAAFSGFPCFGAISLYTSSSWPALEVTEFLSNGVRISICLLPDTTTVMFPLLWSSTRSPGASQ